MKSKPKRRHKWLFPKDQRRYCTSCRLAVVKTSGGWWSDDQEGYMLFHPLMPECKGKP